MPDGLTANAYRFARERQLHGFCGMFPVSSGFGGRDPFGTTRHQPSVSRPLPAAFAKGTEISEKLGEYAPNPAPGTGLAELPTRINFALLGQG